MRSPYGSHFDGNTWPWTLDGEPGWWALHDANGRYVSDACVEGDDDEMRALAAGLRSGERVYFKRCSAWIEEGAWHFCSPRNTMGGDARLPLDRAAELADIIDSALARGAGS